MARHGQGRAQKPSLRLVDSEATGPAPKACGCLFSIQACPYRFQKTLNPQPRPAKSQNLIDQVLDLDILPGSYVSVPSRCPSRFLPAGLAAAAEVRLLVAWLFEQDAAAEALQHRSGYQVNGRGR